MLLLAAEVDKLAAYCRGEITREAISKVTVQTIDAEVFDLSKAILRRDYAGTMGILDKLFYLRVPEINILSALSSAFVDLYRAKAARSADVQLAEAVKSFDYKGRDFRMRNALRDASKYSLAFLKQALEILSQADYRIKSSRTESRIILEQAVTELFAALQNEGRR